MLSLRPQRPCFESRMVAFFCIPFSLFLQHGENTKICTMMIEVSSEQSRSQFYMYTECCCRCYCCSVCCYSAVAAAAVLLIPAAVRHRVPDGKFVAGSLNLIPVFTFSSFKRDIFYGTPWQSYCFAFKASICLHPRQLWACAEPRRASARRGEDPLV